MRVESKSVLSGIFIKEANRTLFLSDPLKCRPYKEENRTLFLSDPLKCRPYKEANRTLFLSDPLKCRPYKEANRTLFLSDPLKCRPYILVRIFCHFVFEISQLSVDASKS